ncbi:hypothetical protein MMC07_006517 [Pseudocyphellaria aurata]|nr:hypothetical protein [Pseudocyphellaria aurata]
MSGFEVVGIVLGAIPLLMSALKHYSDALSTIKYINGYDTVFDTIHISFVASLSIYMNSCETLLSPLIPLDNELHELLEKHDARAWENVELGKSLRERLGQNYNPYVALVKLVNKKIVLFGRKLRLGDEMKPRWIKEDGTVDIKQRAKFFKNPWTCIKGGFESQKYFTLWREIDADIKNIAILTDGAIKLEPIRLERKRRADTTHSWIRIRDHARRLFQTFNSHWSCSCSCQYPHRASLRLDMRKNWEMAQTGPRFVFNLSFDSDTPETVTAAAAAMPWYWRDIEIEPFSVSSNTETLVASERRGTRKFVQLPALPMVVLSSSDIPRPPALPMSVSTAKIADLCKVLRQKTEAKCCLGFLENQSWQDHIYSVTPPILNKVATKPTTLAEIIHQGSNNTRKKCTLALTLASAVLQLHDTPWLRNNWTMEDVMFINDNASTMSSLGQPYVSKIFTPTPSDQDLKVSRPPWITKNEMVYALGIALLELSYAKPIMSFQTPQDLVHGNEAFVERSIAERLSRTIDKRELPNYARATKRCLDCNFDASTYSLNDDDFRDRFYQGVVLPLQQDHEYATSD